jgi:hypothetical protein
MHQYLPWRSRTDLRATLCKVLRKQAIAEYHDINADPARIREDNERLIESVDDKSYKVKGGLLVNQRWNRQASEIMQAREANIERYDMDDEESLQVEVPQIMSMEYMAEAMNRRAASLQIFRAALLAEKARRKGVDPTDLGLAKGSLLRGREVVMANPKTPLKYALDTDKYIFDICEG